jgi:chromate transporter
VISPAASTPSGARAGSLPDLTRYFLRLGTFGFGGPIALVGYMQRDLVEARRWFSDDEFRAGLALAQLAPGPLAAQLAFYLGWVRAGIAGATLIGLAFVIPSLLMVVLLAVAYVSFGELPWMRGAFYGIGAAVIAIIARSVVKLVKLTLASDRWLWALFVMNAAVVSWTESEILWVFVASGVVMLLVRRSRQSTAATGGGLPAFAAGLSGWMTTGLHAGADGGLVWKLFVFFAKGGAVVFGSGLAIVPFLYGGVVRDFGWLTERQFIDAVAVSMITPGPVVITVAFIGYLTAGLVGALAAAAGVFLPVYLITIAVAPHFHRIQSNEAAKTFVSGVTAAATGAIAGAAIVLGRRAIVDWVTVLIAVLTLVLLIKARRIPEPVLIAATGVLGVVLFGLA